MIKPAYSQPGFPENLARSFRFIIKGGRTPVEALVILTMVLRNLEMETVPALPDGWRLILVDGNLKVEALDGSLTDAGEYFYQPTRPVLVRLRQLRSEARPDVAAEREEPAPKAVAVIDEIESGLSAPPSQTAITALTRPAPRASKRGRKSYDTWHPMFDHLDALVRKRGKPFATFTEAADYGLEFLQDLARQRNKEGKGAAVPAHGTIREKISDLRPDLVCD